MAHGDFSDLVFFALVAIVVQIYAFPGMLHKDLGPIKAQFTKEMAADTGLLQSFVGGLLLMIAMTFSGVSWNPVNGKMAGFGGFVASIYTAFSLFKADADKFVPRFFYIYAAVIFLGSMKIFLFPSNGLPKKTPETKNNHGNFSDLIALGLIGSSLAILFYPDHLYQELGPFKAQLITKNADVDILVKLAGGLMLMIGLTLSGVKWNPTNGKMAGLGGFIVAGTTAYFQFEADKKLFVPHFFYIYAVLLGLGALHIFAFPSNPNLVKDKSDKKA